MPSASAMSVSMDRMGGHVYLAKRELIRILLAQQHALSVRQAHSHLPLRQSAMAHARHVHQAHFQRLEVQVIQSAVVMLAIPVLHHRHAHPVWQVSTRM